MSIPDDHAAFEEKQRAQAVALGQDLQVFDAALSALQAADKYDYTYLWSWMGADHPVARGHHGDPGGHLGNEPRCHH